MYAQQEVLVKKPHTPQDCEGGQLVESAEQPSPVSVLDNTHFQEHEFTPNLELAKANCVSSFHGEHTIIPILVNLLLLLLVSLFLIKLFLL
jgi:hypothetical protein